LEHYVLEVYPYASYLSTRRYPADIKEVALLQNRLYLGVYAKGIRGGKSSSYYLLIYPYISRWRTE